MAMVALSGRDPAGVDTGLVPGATGESVCLNWSISIGRGWSYSCRALVLLAQHALIIGIDGACGASSL